MISLFIYDDFRKFIRDAFREMPKAGYGQSRRLAEHVGVHTTLVSQVLQGTKVFTLEQASLVAEFLALNDLETEYFLTLVQLDRAGNEPLRRHFQKRIKELREKSKDLVNRLKASHRLSEQERALFYSDFSFSAIRQMTAIPGYQNVEAIAETLSLPRKKIKEALEFLLSTGLCVERDQKLCIGPSSTHLESNSPWLRNHHVNWRQKAIETLNSDDKANLNYTSPMTLSVADSQVVRELIIQLLEDIDKILEPSPSEELRCLTIDWFKMNR